VPVDNFCEWAKTGTGKQPHAIALADRGLMALAGLLENWRSPTDEWMRTFAIITTSQRAVRAAAQPHAVVFKPEAWPVWLGEEPGRSRVAVFTDPTMGPQGLSETEAAAPCSV
jgi:putative SOS response-associated peptidase YedK